MFFSWVIAICGWYYASTIPDYYQAQARVYVDSDSVLKPLMRGLTIDTDMSMRLRLVTRTMLSRPKMEELAKNAGLVTGETSPGEVDAVVGNLQKTISLVAEERQTNLYTLSYQDPDPDAAVRVVNALVQLLDDSTVGQEREDASTAQGFLEAQVKESEERLREHENRLKDFKRENVAVVSNMGDGYFEKLSAAKAEYGRAQLELREAANRRNELRRQMVEEKTMPSFNFGSASDNPLDMRIQELRKRLDEMLLEYTDRHPEVIPLKESLADLENKKQEMDASSPADTGEDMAENSPVYQALKISLSAADAEVASLNVRVSVFRSRVKELEDLVNSVPEIEAQMTALTRNYENEKKQYEVLSERLGTARMSEQVEQIGSGGVKLIEPPRLPKQPSGPNRMLLNSGILLGSLAAGMALALLLSQLFPAVYFRRELTRITGFPVIGEISLILTGQQAMKRKIQLGGFLSALGLLLVVYGIVILSQGSVVTVHSVSL